MVTMQQEFKYFAFISYSSRDMKWGKKLQRQLEGYRMPATLCSEHGWKRKPINPIFFAPTDIQPGELTRELQERLKASRNLIVICSPDSARSEWVGMEIEFFHRLGRTANIHFFIVNGVPHSRNPTTECFNPVITTLGLPEILGANINEKIYRWPWLNQERAYVQLITKLLGVEFDSIWKRHRRMLIQKVTAWATGLTVLLATLVSAWILNQPVDVRLSLQEADASSGTLPPLNTALVTMEVDKEIKKDTITDINDIAWFMHVPHRYLGKEVRVSITCPNYMNVDTIMTLSESLNVRMHRDASVYGNVHFRLWNIDAEHTVPGCVVYVDGNKAISDSDGSVSITIPLSRQKPRYRVESNETQLLDSIIYMPCGKDDVICLKDKGG
jgi:tetratricopeptide repeat protein